MSDVPTPATGTPAQTTPPSTDRFGLAVLVTRLMADVAVLKESVDKLEDEDDRHSTDVSTMRAEVHSLKEQFGRLHIEIASWKDASTTATAGMLGRLGALERKIAGATGILVLLEVAIEAYKSAHGH